MKKYIYFSLIAVFVMMIYGGGYLLNKSYSANINEWHFENNDFQRITVDPSTDGIQRPLGIRIFSLEHNVDPYEIFSAYCGKAGKSVHEGAYSLVRADSYFNGSRYLNKLKKVLFAFTPVPIIELQDDPSMKYTKYLALKEFFKENFPDDFNSFNFDMINENSSLYDTINAINLMLDTMKTLSRNKFVNYLKTNNLYSDSKGGTLNPDELSYQEIATSVQFAIWYFSSNGSLVFNSDEELYTGPYYSPGIDRRISVLSNILRQESSELPNIDNISRVGGFRLDNISYNNNSLVFDVVKDNIYAVLDDINSINLSLANNVPVRNEDKNCSEIGDVIRCTVTGISQTESGSFKYNDRDFNTIYADLNINGAAVKTAYVYKPMIDNRQIWIGTQSSSGTSVEKLSISVPNVINNNVVFKKVDANNLTNLLNGASLELYRCDDGQTCNNKSLVTNFVSGTTPYTIELSNGYYTIVETVTPTGYVIPNRNNVDINNNASTIKTISNEVFLINDYNKEVLVLNSKTYVSFAKNDDEGHRLAGAKFNIVDANGNVYYSFISNSSTTVLDGILDNGVYFLIETQAPTNYVLDSNIYRFVIGDRNEFLVNGNLPNMKSSKYTNRTVVDLDDTLPHIVVNKKGISISKRESNNVSNYVVGAELTITDSNNQVVQTITSKNSDIVVTLQDGTYTLTETKTPNGYVTSSPITFTIRDGLVEGNVDLNMKDARLDVCFMKTSSDVSGGLSGAKFEVLDENNNLIDTFTSTSEMYCIKNTNNFNKYKPGKYKLREIKAPDGYKKLDRDLLVEIKDIPTRQLFKIQNEIMIADTALDTNKIIYLASIIFGVFGIAFIMIYARKYDF